jgi:uncharacterized heparinase superfamily protein
MAATRIGSTAPFGWHWLARLAHLVALADGLLKDRLAGACRRRYADLARRTPFARPRGRMSEPILPVGPGLRPGDPETGAAMLAEGFVSSGRHVVLSETGWHPPGAPDGLIRSLHGFGWLGDLTAAGPAGAARARALIESWIATTAGRSGSAAATEIVAERLAQWLLHADRLLAGCDPTFRTRFLASALEAASWLGRALPAELAGASLLAAAKALLLAGLALPRGGAWRRRGLDLVARELARQILPDGGHIERCPSTALALLADLCELAQAFARRDEPVPGSILGAIRVMAPALRLMQHGDGGLALFNGGYEERAGHVERVLAAAGGSLQALAQAPQTGFQRLAAGKTIAILDCGAPPPAGFDRAAHAGTFALELSVGRERLIVNCGSHPEDATWREAMRATAAHSALVVADTNSSGLFPGGVGHRPGTVICKREESGGSTWLELSHDGYRRHFGLRHRRRLYLAQGGADLRGEDALDGPRPAPFQLRFHLHPDVQVSLVQSGQAAILKTAGGVGWRLRVEGGAMSLADSVYLGERGRIRRSQQILVEARHEGGETRLRWALAREARRRERRASEHAALAES